VLDQNSAHDVGGGGKKARPIVPRVVLVRDQSQIGFVNEGRGLELVIHPFMPELNLGDPPQFRIDEAHQPRRSTGVTSPKHAEEERYLTWLRGLWALHLSPSAPETNERVVARRATTRGLTRNGISQMSWSGPVLRHRRRRDGSSSTPR
jgi:hypothetical protein